MGTMGRRRKDSGHGMEPRVYERRRVFFYVHRGTGKWESLGKDKDAANRKARLYNDPDDLYGTVVYWLEQFLLTAKLE